MTQARVYIGTSGWSYPKGAGTWQGTFYPPKLADKDKLAFYAQYFTTVELNSSFYRPPNQYATDWFVSAANRIVSCRSKFRPGSTA